MNNAVLGKNDGKCKKSWRYWACNNCSEKGFFSVRTKVL